MNPTQVRNRTEPQDPTATAAAGRLVHPHTLAERYDALAHHPFERRGVDRALRGLDVATAATLMVLTAPLLALLCLAVLVSSGRPVLYRGPRVGRGGTIFTMIKVRTLRPQAEERIGHLQDAALDAVTGSEYTPIGRLLRVTQLDELPQLWNVLRGEMSIVGPRPIRPIFFEQLIEELPQYWQRLVVRPGLTGFAQLRMRRDMTWAEKLAHDLEYLADRSVPLYVRMVAATTVRIAVRIVRDVPAVLAGRPAAQG
ncbi:MAG: wcaJ [Solirubrobacteraceae bacterium]|nr:wcaJ [Solirubrobacteraceae bacterium]